MLEKPIGSKVDFVFDKKIYNPEAVRRAASEYSGAAAFKVSNVKAGVSVSISGMASGGETELCGEFLNYVLYLTKSIQV